MSKYEILNYETGSRFNLIEDVHHLQSIKEELIRLSVKITEHFASDILYPIDEMLQAVTNRTVYRKLLCFREYGVDSVDVESHGTQSFYVTAFLNPAIIQYWLLDVDPVGDCTVTLKRVGVV